MVKFKPKDIFKILFYLSFVFLVYYLYTSDYLIIPKFKNYLWLLFSVLLLLLGTIYQAINWKYVLAILGINSSVRQSIISVGLSIFMKYIPGKVLVVLGRAAYISNKYSVSLTVTTGASLLTQLITLWTGLLLGLLVIFGVNIGFHVNLLIIISLIVLSTPILYPGILYKIAFLINKLLKKNIYFPSVALIDLVKTIPSFILTWLLWGFGFYFLSLSAFPDNTDIRIALAFPLAATLGIIALVAPGGIGVREGLLVGVLVLLDFQVSEATTVALLSRLWFLIGESFVFLISVLLKTKSDDPATINE
jgi:glycosyltransferase 2 family protein